MKKFLIVAASLVALLVVALLVAPALIPVETYKSQLLARIEKATGRPARIGGDLRLSLLPRVRLVAGQVSLANAPGGKAQAMVSLDKLEVVLDVIPLLSGIVAVDTFVLNKPVINLEIDRQGRPNWRFAGDAPAARETPPAGRPEGEGSGMAPGGLELGDVRLVDGRVTYSDARTGASYVASGIDMAVSLPSLSGPLKADGSLVWNQEKIALELGLAKPDAFLAGKPSRLTASVESRPVTLTFAGEAAHGERARASGALALDVPSVRMLAAWAGRPLALQGSGLGPLKVTGQVEVDGQKYGFTQARVTLDSNTATGELRYDGGRKKPYLNARLETGILDINPYMPSQAPAGGAAKPAPGPAAGAGRPAPDGWSEEPIDLTGLRQIDADVALRVAGLRVRKIKVGESRLTLALKDGRLTTDLADMKLYDGSGKARLVADASGRTPALSASLELSGVQANPALSDAMDFDRIEGILGSSLQVSTQGGSQRALVSALDGSGKFAFADGAIRGINVAAMVRNLRGAFLDPAARGEQKTDFTKLAGTYSIKNGILRNDDLALLSPLLRVSGRGTVNLPQRTVDYRIEPKVVASTKGQGGETALGGVMVPVIVSGPWSNLSYRPDLSGAVGEAVKDPSKALEGLKDLIPGARKPGDGGTTSPSPADALKELFRR